jgi:phenylalanyl-tRNA synthetase alpha chain
MQNENIKAIKAEIEAFEIVDKLNLETFKSKYTGKSGVLQALFSQMRDIDPAERKTFGALVNELKELAEQKFNQARERIEAAAESQSLRPQDLSLPVRSDLLGNIHPLQRIHDRVVEIFAHIGFSVAQGPEIEDDHHNFTALNFPLDHPARLMQDTFFIEKGQNDVLLRTHTSTVQVRLMESQSPPIRAIMPGRVYRNETVSARAHCFFHQVEGLYVDENVSFADLKQTLLYFAQEMFGEKTQIRLRPSFFPFTEPSAELDISCFVCEGQGCAICKHSGWVEIGGCGMVDPHVLEACSIDSEKYSGFALGFGIERITLLRYKINDLRLFSENDVRFLNQFHSV